MFLETELRDCLYLNWALPERALPRLPDALRFDTIEDGGEPYAFASAVLLRQRGVHLRGLPALAFSHPQCNVRLYALDADDVPSIFFVRMFLPLALVPAVRAALRQPAESARFDFPRDRESAPAGPWRWSVEAGATLTVEGRPGSPSVVGPRVGEWERTVAFFRERARGYAILGRKLRRLETSHPPVDSMPIAARLEATELLAASLPEVERERFATLHSAFLCPRVALTVEVESRSRVSVPEQVPAAG